MTNKESLLDGNLFIVDNGDEKWKVKDYLREWTEIARQFDIATGYFEIGALLTLDTYWQKLEKIRILMGDEVSLRTKNAYQKALNNLLEKLDQSIDTEKEKNDFLTGVPSIVDSIQNNKIETRVYKKKKFHAKAYITHSKLRVVGPTALVGSSNFTYPGLSQNIELNIQLQREVEKLQEWYETHWEDAEEIKLEILKTITRHTKNYTPFEVYAKSMVAYFRGHNISVGEWEKSSSVIYPILSQYQKEGYHRLMDIANRYNGALLCDGVGLGKTFIGLMIIERLLFERKKVALIVPKSTRNDVWEAKIKRFLPYVGGRFSNLAIYNHTDLLREGDFKALIEEIKHEVDAIVIDEAHNFRNISSNPSKKLYEICEGKQLFMLTATPINNSSFDLLHLIEYFSRNKPDYFKEAPLGIHSLRGHFRKLETALESVVNSEQVGEDMFRLAFPEDNKTPEEILSNDLLFQELVVQRSRAYVKRSITQEKGRNVHFPERQDPIVAEYSLKKTYGRLLDLITDAFRRDDPLVKLPIYFPLDYYKGPLEVDEFDVGRQKQVVGLIRTLLLKRFESSAVSFRASCEDLLLKLLLFLRLNANERAKHWERRHADLLTRIANNRKDRGLSDLDTTSKTDDEEALEEDIIPEEFKKKIETLDSGQFKVQDMVLDVLQDMDTLVGFLHEINDFTPADDDKLQRLIHLLRTDPILKENKVLIFTEFQSTARYLYKQLREAGISPLQEVDSARQNSSEAVHAFSPYYNESSPDELELEGKQEIRVLISTDVLAEGLNLQDAACIINYDLHWNPVRLMQRIGRVDRRLDAEIEAAILADRPELTDIRGKVYLWNFLPPDELNEILSLYERVTKKTLRISKMFGIEGKKLLTPDDDYEALKNFSVAYEGVTTSNEEMYLIYQKLIEDFPELPEQVQKMPSKVFSGKLNSAENRKAVFFCVELPEQNHATGEWDELHKRTRWYVYDFKKAQFLEDGPSIFPLIRCTPDEERKNVLDQKTLVEIREGLDKHITNTYLKRVQAPMHVNHKIIAWMELVGD